MCTAFRTCSMLPRHTVHGYLFLNFKEAFHGGPTSTNIDEACLNKMMGDRVVYKMRKLRAVSHVSINVMHEMKQQALMCKLQYSLRTLY